MGQIPLGTWVGSFGVCSYKACTPATLCMLYGFCSNVSLQGTPQALPQLLPQLSDSLHLLLTVAVHQRTGHTTPSASCGSSWRAGRSTFAFTARCTPSSRVLSG